MTTTLERLRAGGRRAGRHALGLGRTLRATTQGDPLDGLSLTARVVQDGLRLYPSARMVARRVARPFVLGDALLEENTLLMVRVHAIRIVSCPKR